MPIAKCPDCGKVISLRLPLHDCTPKPRKPGEFRVGDYVYYIDPDGGHIPTVIDALNWNGTRAKVRDTGKQYKRYHPSSRWVSTKRLELQTEG